MSGFVAAISAKWTGKTDLLSTTIGGFFSQFFARLTYKSSGIIFLLLLFTFFEFVFPKTNLAFVKASETFDLETTFSTRTNTAFSEKTNLTTQVLSFKSRTIPDSSLAMGETKVVQEGAAGKKVIQIKTILHNGQKYAVENIVVSETKPIEEVLAVHPSILAKTIESPYGTLKYTGKLNVWATSYDPFCPGCNQTTSIGLKAGFGVIAVDPKIIPLRSKVYIPGYGIAIAGDTGGSIKGNKIDLGFDDVRNGNWSARFTDIYILTD